MKATATTAVRDDVRPGSIGDEFIDYEEWLRPGEPEVYVWGVKWEALYPGMRFVPDSDEARQWSEPLGLRFQEVRIETRAQPRLDLLQPPGQHRLARNCGVPSAATAAPICGGCGLVNTSDRRASGACTSSSQRA